MLASTFMCFRARHVNNILFTRSVIKAKGSRMDSSMDSMPKQLTYTSNKDTIEEFAITHLPLYSNLPITCAIHGKDPYKEFTL